MPDSEKLIELMGEAIDYSVGTCIEHRDCEGCPGRKYGNKCRDYLEANHLIANGVAVGKPLTEYLHPIDNYAGLKGKYLVFKADTGEQVSNCFVLRPDKDTAAVEALRAYANTTDNKTLAEDIYNWVGKGEPVQEWISVTDGMPELIPCDAGTAYSEAVNVLTSGRKVLTAIWDGFDWICDAEFWDAEDEEITHWTPVLLPLPEPPKENEK